MLLQMQIIDFIMALIGFVLIVAFVIGVPMVLSIGVLFATGFLCSLYRAFF